VADILLPMPIIDKSHTPAFAYHECGDDIINWYQNEQRMGYQLMKTKSL